MYRVFTIMRHLAVRTCNTMQGLAHRLLSGSCWRHDLLLIAVALVLTGCHAASVAKPSIQITRVPVADPGGPVKMDYIAGRASGAPAGAEVVVYAHSGLWWIQPFANEPFTRIQPDSTWQNSTHLGTEFAALLVEPSYHPLAKLSTLPPAGNGVLAVATMEGKPGVPIASKIVHFSGFDWTARAASSDRGGEPSYYDPANVWTDQNGYLHLRMQPRNGHWTCAQVSMNRSLGYGTYVFVVQDTGHFRPSNVLGLYTLDELRQDEVRAELDVELSRWGIPTRKNAQFVVQPFYVPENVSRFDVPDGVLTHSFRWESGRAWFKTVRGAQLAAGAPVVSEHLFTSSVPTPATENVHIDLYDFRHSREKSQEPVEVVVEKFEFLP